MAILSLALFVGTGISNGQVQSKPPTLKRVISTSAGILDITSYSLTVDAEDNVYVLSGFNPAGAPSFEHYIPRIQKFSTNGAGLAEWYYNRDPISAPYGQYGAIAVDSAGHPRLLDYPAYPGGLVTFNEYGHPTNTLGVTGSDLVFDVAGNMFVANGDIIKYDPQGQEIGRFVWNPGTNSDVSGYVFEFHRLALDAAGNVYAAGGVRLEDQPYNRRVSLFFIQKFSPDGTFLGEWKGVGSQAGQFQGILSLDTDASGRVFVLDGGYYDGRVRVFDSNGVFQATWGSRSDGTFAERPQDLKVDSHGRVYVLETPPDTDSSAAIHVFDAEGQHVVKWGRSGVVSEWADAHVAVDSRNHIYYALRGRGIRQFSPTGSFLRERSFPEFDGFSSGGIRLTKGNQLLVGTGEGEQLLDTNLQTIRIWGDYSTTAYFAGMDSRGYVYGGGNDYIWKFSPQGKLVKSWVAYTRSLFVDAKDQIYTVYDGVVSKWTTGGVLIQKWRHAPGRPTDSNIPYDDSADLYVDKAGNVYVADEFRNRIQKFDKAGKLLWTMGREGKGEGEFFSPTGITMDQAGDLYVADLGNRRIQVFSTQEGEEPYLTGWRNRYEVVEGVTLTLPGTAVGAKPLAYQWFFEDKPMAGATNAGLFLGGVDTKQSGRYQLEVSNAFGVVRKQARLTVLDWTNTTAVYQRHKDGQLALWQMAGTNVVGNFLLAPKGPSVASGWTRTALGDLNGDGYLDVILGHTDGRLQVRFFARTNYLGMATLPRAASSASGWRLAGCNDFTGDGQNDLVWRHGDGRITVWQMTGTNLTAKIKLPQRGLTTAGGWSLVAVRDWDGDGDGDFLWRHNNGHLRWWEMAGTDYVQTWKLDRVGPTAMAGNRLVAVPTGADGRQDDLWWQNVNSQSLRTWEFTGKNYVGQTYLRERQPLGSGWTVIGAE